MPVPQAVRRERGFTLIELLIVVVVVGVALVMALPRVTGVRRSIQLDAAAQQFVGDLRRARIEALKRNTSIRVDVSGMSSYRIDSIGVRELAGGVRFSSGATSVRFASFGPPLTGAASFTLALGSRTKTVSLNAAGLLSVK